LGEDELPEVVGHVLEELALLDNGEASRADHEEASERYNGNTSIPQQMSITET
jgi:hypothetical protein